MKTRDEQISYLKGLNLITAARDRYRISRDNFGKSGKLKFLNLLELKKTVSEINKIRGVDKDPLKVVKAGEINAITLLNEADQIILANYKKMYLPELTGNILNFLEKHYGRDKLESIKSKFIDLFTVDIPRAEIDEFSFSIFFPELLITWLNNQNRAFQNYQELFSDVPLVEKTSYPELIEVFEFFFDQQASPGNSGKNLIHFLREPAVRFPDSISKQIDFIIENWGFLLGDFLEELLRAQDLIREEEKAGFTGPGPSVVYQFQGDEEYERFSLDSDWMPNLVMLAKSTYVWLDQLSRKYSREIRFLQDIPDEELQLLARRGFTGLWLIGVWQRSESSRRIKHINGDLEAIASAYSISEYRVADELGGDRGMELLQSRAWKYGIRVACDMVPNHMGLDSQWIIDHPDWFLQLTYPPFPAYSFNGENLSGRDGITVQLEDHYYSRSDAAVVFKLVNHHDGKTRYVYHGNDGTSIPWNDTAQLDFLNSEMRESLIRVIVGIARKFPIIRFDAAMTLAKRHIQRLWYPPPGSGGDIPSRSEFGLTKAEFDRQMPIEFWREVVDRVAREAPDTLLLAEAFWMMEGYFVRTLGMHRVYNSAFMNMLKNEENAQYRQSIFNILEFDPEILKRFVNFMSNPDEETAIAQFGSDDKYFGVCVLMVTMPGLPMFAHGQIEGFQERYGMEFSRARWRESENHHLLERHQREIFPLLRQRSLFSSVDKFLLFDFQREDGSINENVFTYTNEHHSEKSLVIFNNKYEETRGWIRNANKPTNSGTGISWEKISLGKALNISGNEDSYIIFRDHISKLEYIRNSREINEQGLYKELGAFKYSVLMNFREVEDSNGFYAQLAEYLQGGGAGSIDRSLNKLRFGNSITEFTAFFTPQNMGTFLQMKQRSNEDRNQQFLAETAFRIENLLIAHREDQGTDSRISGYLNEILADIRFWLKLETVTGQDNRFELIIIPLIVISRLIRIKPEDESEAPLHWLKDLFWTEIIAGSLRKTGLEIHDDYLELLLKDLLKKREIWQKISLENDLDILNQLLEDNDTRKLLNINSYQGVIWFDGDRFKEYLALLEAINLLSIRSLIENERKFRSEAGKWNAFIARIKSAESRSEYKLEKLISEFKTEPE